MRRFLSANCYPAWLAGVWATCPDGHGLCVGIAGAPVCNVPWQESHRIQKCSKPHWDLKNTGSLHPRNLTWIPQNDGL